MWVLLIQVLLTLHLNLVKPIYYVCCLSHRGTTVPIPGDGDYAIVFAKTLLPNTAAVDCSDVMPEINVPVPQQGTTAGLTTSRTLKESRN